MLILIKILLYFVVFKGRLVDKNTRIISAYETDVKYIQYICYLCFFFGVVINLSPREFKRQNDCQSSRIGSASGASNHGYLRGAMGSTW